MDLYDGKLITAQEWEEFFKQYTIDFMSHSDYRLGQAFCNHFGSLVDVLDKTHLLFYKTDNREAFNIIKQYVDGEIDDPFSR